MDSQTTLAVIGISLAITLWGVDKIFDYGKTRYPSIILYLNKIELALGIVYFIIGIGLLLLFFG